MGVISTGEEEMIKIIPSAIKVSYQKTLGFGIPKGIFLGKFLRKD